MLAEHEFISHRRIYLVAAQQGDGIQTDSRGLGVFFDQQHFQSVDRFGDTDWLLGGADGKTAKSFSMCTEISWHPGSHADGQVGRV